MIDDLVAVILAGGSGTRLWPVSRAAFPKHLVDLVGDRSLLQATAGRVAAVTAAPDRLVTVGAASQSVEIRRQLAAVDPRMARHLLLEPAARNTAAAVALAALHVRRAWGGATLLWICPSDHLIGRPAALYEAVALGAPAARAGRLVTFAITPTRPETGYGYIARGAPLPGAPGVFAVERFVEKPCPADAEAMLASGGFAWNSGMFLFAADTILAELKRHAPAILAATEAAMRDGADSVAIDAEAFSAVPSAPIDKAVMERSDRVAVVPCDPDWSDLGSWQAIWEIMPRDAAGNAAKGDVLIEAGRDNLVRAEHRLVALAGVDGLAVVETADAVLVTSREMAEPVKAVVGRLVEQAREEAERPRRRLQPWGVRTVLLARPGHVLDELELDPGAAIEDAAGDGRRLAWMVVEGRVEIAVGGTSRICDAGESASAKPEETFALRNPGPDAARLLELAIGDRNRR